MTIWQHFYFIFIFSSFIVLKVCTVFSNSVAMWEVSEVCWLHVYVLDYSCCDWTVAVEMCYQRKKTSSKHLSQRTLPSWWYMEYKRSPRGFLQPSHCKAHKQTHRIIVHTAVIIYCMWRQIIYRGRNWRCEPWNILDGSKWQDRQWWFSHSRLWFACRRNTQAFVSHWRKIERE